MANESLPSQPDITGDTIQLNTAEIREAAPDIKSNKKKRKTKGSRTVTLIFYTCYFAMVAAVLAGLFLLNSQLEAWLRNYEASQPTVRCEEIFRDTFAEPDWIELYTLAGITDTDYESSAAFAAYMNGQVNGRDITYAETHTDIPGSHKYLLQAGDDTIGCFTLVDQAPEGTDLPVWQLGEVELNYAYDLSVTVQKAEGVTVFVNGVALTDDHTIRIDTIRAEDYLPEHIHGPRVHTQHLDGLLVAPTITAADSDGNALQVSFDKSTGIHTVLTAVMPIDEEAYESALMTARTYALYVMAMTGTAELEKFFDTASPIYEAIAGYDSTVQPFRSYDWGKETIDGYCRYNEDLFSVHVKLPLHITRMDYTVTEYVIDHTFFFENQDNAWRCFNMTEADIREQRGFVRVTFLVGDSVIFTNLFPEDVTNLEVPILTAPVGQVFAGWFRQVSGADGDVGYSLVFAPDASGVINLPSGTKLEPMTLYALFEDAPGNGGN